MSFVGQIQAQLKADNTDFKAKMAESEGVAIGSADRMLKGVGAKFTDLRNAGVALAVAVGLNIQSMAENVARAFTGMSKPVEELFKKIADLSDKNTASTISAIKARESAEQTLQKGLAESARLERERLDLEKQRGNEAAAYNEILKLTGDAHAAQLAQQQVEIQNLKIVADLEANKSAQIAVQGEMAKAQSTIDKANEQRKRDFQKAFFEAAEEGFTENFEAQQKIAETEGVVVAKKTDQLGLVKATVAAVEEQAKAEEKVTDAIESQNEALRVGFEIRGRDDEDISDRALNDKIRTLSRSVAARERRLRENPANATSVASGGFYDPFLGFERDQLSRAQAELAARQNIRGQVARFGENGAARLYQGNMPEFERLLRFVTEQGEAKQTRVLLERIDQRLGNSGLFPKF